MKCEDSDCDDLHPYEPEEGCGCEGGCHYCCHFGCQACLDKAVMDDRPWWRKLFRLEPR
jgi:hypothetical protein